MWQCVKMCLLELTEGGKWSPLFFRMISHRKKKHKKNLAWLCTTSLAMCYAVETEVVLFKNRWQENLEQRNQRTSKNLRFLSFFHGGGADNVQMTSKNHSFFKYGTHTRTHAAQQERLARTILCIRNYPTRRRNIGSLLHLNESHYIRLHQEAFPAFSVCLWHTQ